MTTTPTITPGLKFFNEHMQYVMANDIAGMVANTYTEDAKFYSTFPFLDTPPPNVFQGREEIIKAQKTIFERQGKIQADPPYNFIENEEFISFQIKITSPNTGKWIVTDVWAMRDGKIAHQFVLGDKIGDN